MPKPVELFVPVPGREALHMPELPLRLRDYLDPDVAAGYDEALPLKKQLHYERGLHKIWRMGKVREFVPIDPHTESNLEHVARTLVNVNTFMPDGSPLHRAINRGKVQRMVLWHDGVEMPKGDLPTTDRTPEQDWLKANEHLIARDRLLHKIPDPEQQQIIWSDIERFTNDNPHDLVVQMAKLADKVQGMEGILLATGPYAENPVIAERLKNHVARTLPDMLAPAIHLLTYLPDQDQRQAISNIALDKMAMLDNFGHHDAVDSYRDAFAA